MADLQNPIKILIDFLNRYFLACYGIDWLKTPNVEAIAKSGTGFEQHYFGSAPCMPSMRELWTST